MSIIRPVPVDPAPETLQDGSVVAPKKPRRNQRSAKKAGALFEQQTADYIADRLDDDRIERRVMGGVNDRGDISNVRTLQGARVVIECKNVSTMALGSWVNEAEIERGNDDALIGVVVHKRRGVGDAGQQFVTMTLDTFVTLLDGGIDR
jgi:hypothetical protein